MRPVFYWGLEYETSLLLYDPNGFNSKVVWQDKKVKLTCEVFEKIHGDMTTQETGYWDSGKRSHQLNQRGMFIIESQIGLFSGFDVKSCFTQLHVLEQKLKEMMAYQRLIYNYQHFKSFPVFTYGYTVDEDVDTDYFLDYSMRKPGLYILDDTHPESEFSYFGYRAVDVNKNDVSGVPQLTCSFDLKYFPLLIETMSKYTRLEQNKESYRIMLDYTHRLSIPDTHARAFILYLVDYFVMYLHYDPSDKENYFKTFYDVKPRTNPAALYETLSATSKRHIQSLRESLDARSDLDRYLVAILGQLTTTECVYIGKPIDKKILPGLYTYDASSEELVEAIETNVDRYEIEDAPCVNMPDPLGKNIKRLPSLSLHDDTGKFNAGFPIDLWEWNVKNKEHPRTCMVSIELRDFNDLVHMSIQIMKEHGRDTDYRTERMDMDIQTFKKGLDLVFKFFFPTVFKLQIRPRSKKSKKTSKKKSKKKSKKTSKKK
jgi:hypothetical protein